MSYCRCVLERKRGRKVVRIVEKKKERGREIDRESERNEIEVDSQTKK